MPPLPVPCFLVCCMGVSVSGRPRTAGTLRKSSGKFSAIDEHPCSFAGDILNHNMKIATTLVQILLTRLATSFLLIKGNITNSGTDDIQLICCLCK